MLNFRKIKQDFSSNILKQGRDDFIQNKVIAAKALKLTSNTLRISGRVQGNFENSYENEIEIDRMESEVIDSNCDCPYHYDCQHIAALLFYLEENINKILVDFSKSEKKNAEESTTNTSIADEGIVKTLQAAEGIERTRLRKKHDREALEEYKLASGILGCSPYFLPKEEISEDKAELAIICNKESFTRKIDKRLPEIQIALRLPFRSKPLYVPSVKIFFDGIRNQEPIFISGKKYFFSYRSFNEPSRELLNLTIDHARFFDSLSESYQRFAKMEWEAMGTLLAKGYELLRHQLMASGYTEQLERQQQIPCFYLDTLESPLLYSPTPAELQFEIEILDVPSKHTKKIFLQPKIEIPGSAISPEEGVLFECAKPGLIHARSYYRFGPHIRRAHLRHLSTLRNIAIPLSLFGTFIENALPELQRFAKVNNQKVLNDIVTLPFVGEMSARCKIEYLNGELEAKLYFLYNEIEIPATNQELSVEHIHTFTTEEGILARNLTEEHQLINRLFPDFIFNQTTGSFIAKTEKKVVEFMTEVIPANRDRVTFDCPENLLNQFIYDNTKISLALKGSNHINKYTIEMKVDGDLEGTEIDYLWECIQARKNYIELKTATNKIKKSGKGSGIKQRILILDLGKLTPVVQIFDEMGIKKIANSTIDRPLWSLTTIREGLFDGLPVTFSMSPKIKGLQKQILGTHAIDPTPIPKEIQATLRNYQVDGVHWLERLRTMHLSGILADDMGLGKTLQAIVAIAQNKALDPKNNKPALVVCPTSLLYNWQEEFHKFSPKLKTTVIDGTPQQRKRNIQAKRKCDAFITSYNLLQKDINFYQDNSYSYIILDEAQHIKNRMTRNAKSVKMLSADHRLILTGTPIENSLDELWSLFDFLMPGLLSSYERFVEKYIRNPGYTEGKDLKALRSKVSPFILRRMKEDVLSDLPPVSEILYHCHLTPKQQQLYSSYAKSAREELQQLVKKEGFEKVQIHILATLTRLKQICCHPAIFAQETVKRTDSSKFDLLIELLTSLVEGGHKTVIFSQYTKMLAIMREELESMGMQFCYLDGSSKNRLDIVKKFNNDPAIPIFLVSLKAGGTGLNLTGADTVIHYDMWWNPAVENQATDRIHRIGQNKPVCSYKLVTLGTIEEKILELQKRKKGLVKKVVNCDDEALSKLKWEEVLELLQT
ncbi:SNF2 helicase associated domain-containing protein [Simkania negevensis]|uniref:SNF2 helicase associated domain-containing protein n=1 Tax=Simkania negevensis TaxID=83561 RepID=A0ABS3AV25_9BACT|nr:SNF2 helicase associated domain-containing protein [Simkania negevensis]